MHSKKTRFCCNLSTSIFEGKGRRASSAVRKFSTNFELPKQFVDGYRNKKVKFGFNGLGEIAYLRTYSRKMSDGTNEQWADTVERIVNG